MPLTDPQPAILHILPTLGTGGAESVAIELAQGLLNQGVRAEIAVFGPPYDLKEAAEKAGVKVHMGAPGSRRSICARASWLARLAAERDIDIIHAHLLWPGLYAGLAKLMPGGGFKTVIQYHNLAYAPGANRAGMGLMLLKAANSLISRFAMDRRLAVSSAVAAHYKQALHLQNVDLLPNPVDLKLIAKAAKAGPSLWPASDSDGGLRLLLPGRLVHEKGHLDALDAAKILRENGLNFSLVFAGEGPLRPQIEAKISEYGLGELVHLVGRLAHADLLGLMSAASIIIIPSRFEGFGLTAAEALALGKPVIATDAGGLTDIVIDGKTGLTIPAYAPAALADMIDKLRQDHILGARLGQGGQNHVADNFSAEMITTKLIGIYQELLVSKSR